MQLQSVELGIYKWVHGLISTSNCVIYALVLVFFMMVCFYFCSFVELAPSVLFLVIHPVLNHCLFCSVQMQPHLSLAASYDRVWIFIFSFLYILKIRRKCLVHLDWYNQCMR
jgi:hypothetical protein